MKNKNNQSPTVKFGKRIKKLRNARSISQEKLAELASVHRTYIGMIERGEKNITMLSMLKLANALEITLSDLFEDFEDGK